MNSQIEGFFTFVREQGVVGLAVGFILGGAVSKVVASLVEDIINPIIGIAIGGGEALSELAVHVGPIELRWGNFVAVIVDFLVIALVVYYGVKGLGLDKIDKKKDK